MIFMADRVTRHNQRKGKNGAFNPNHNDRNYDFDTAENIVADKTKNNIYWNWTHKGFYRHNDRDNTVSFEEAENKYYKKAFNKQWADTNYKYQQQRHPEKIKTWEEWSKQDRYLPEETVLQVGNMEQHCSEQQLYNAVKRYLQKMQNWSKQHNNCFQLLDLGFHFDEEVPHMHERKVWQYRNSDGTLCIGQEKALEQAGIPLPDPSKKKSRYNNRKMTFDKMAREMFLESCKEVGLDIIAEPVEGAVHNRTKQQLIYDKQREKQQQLDDREAEIALKEAQIASKQSQNDIAIYQAYIADRGLKEDFKNFYMAYGEETTREATNQLSR